MGLLDTLRYKARGLVRFPGRSLMFFDRSRPGTDALAEQVGDGTNSDVLMSPVRWLQRSIVEAPWHLRDAKGEPVEASDLLDLLGRPNPYYSADVLLSGTVLSLSLTGNAYWILCDNAAGRPAEIWYAPHGAVEPKFPATDNTKFLTHYSYRVAGGVQLIAPAGADPADVPGNVVPGLSMLHFREGVDLDNLRLGLSPLRGLLREIWTDNEAASFTASLLRNNGIPGVIVSPSDKGELLTQDQADAAKQKLAVEFTGEGRGKPIVMLGPTKVEQFGFSPKDLDLSPLRDISEERVCAALGVPAAVVGFGSGLQQTRVGATMRELRQLAWTNGVIPLQRRIAGEVTRTLVPLFPEAATASFDNSEVEALRENQDTRATRIERLVRAGVLTRGEGRTELGFEAAAGDDVYLVSLATIEVPRNGNGSGILERSALPLLALPAGVKETVEERIIARSPRAQPRPVVQQVSRRLDTIRRGTAEAFEQRLADVFEALGQSAARAVTDLDVQFNSAASYIRRRTGYDDDGQVKQDWLTDVLARTDISAATAALESLYGELYLSSAAEAAGALTEVLGVEFVINDPVQRTVLREGGLRAGLVDLSEQTREAIFEGLAEARAEGLTADNLARRIRDRVTAGPWRDAATRARVIARTEGAHAANTATLTAARSMRATNHVQVFDNRTGHNDEICAAADGIVVTIDEGEAMGLSHPNCLPGSAMVLAPNLHSTMTRHFHGELVVLRTADNQLFSCTPNHPILTDHGWVPAGALLEGAYVMRCLDAERMAAIIDPYHDHVPTAVEEIDRAFAVTLGVSTTRMPSAAEHFHGDGTVGHIDVVRSDGFAERAGPEQRQQLAVVGSDVELPPLSSSRPLGLGLEAIRSPTPGDIGVSRQVSTLAARQFGVSHESGRGKRPQRQSSMRETAAHGGLSNANLDSDLFTGLAGQVEPVQDSPIALRTAFPGAESKLGKVSPKRRLANAGIGAYIGDPIAGLVAPVEVVKIERRQFSGQVFNLETEQGWYVADGIVTHNCTRSFVPINSVLLEEMGIAP